MPGVNIDRVGDYWLSWRVPLPSKGGLKKFGKDMKYSSAAAARGNGIPTITYGTSWFYQYRPNGSIYTFRRPWTEKGNWQYTDSPRVWTQSTANNIVSEGRVRWVQIGTYRLGAFGGSIRSSNYSQGNSGSKEIGSTAYAKTESAEVFGALLESGYIPSAITGSLVTSGWGGLGGNINLGSKPSQLNKTTFNVPQNAGPLYLAKFGQTVDGFPARGVVDRGFQYGSKGDGKYWTGNAFYDKTNSFWFTMGRNVWSYGELQYKGMRLTGYQTSDAHITYKDQIARGQFVEL